MLNQLLLVSPFSVEADQNRPNMKLLIQPYLNVTFNIQTEICKTKRKVVWLSSTPPSIQQRSGRADFLLFVNLFFNFVFKLNNIISFIWCLMIFDGANLLIDQFIKYLNQFRSVEMFKINLNITYQKEC